MYDQNNELVAVANNVKNLYVIKSIATKTDSIKEVYTNVLN